RPIHTAGVRMVARRDAELNWNAWPVRWTTWFIPCFNTICAVAASPTDTMIRANSMMRLSLGSGCSSSMLQSGCCRCGADLIEPAAHPGPVACRHGPVVALRRMQEPRAQIQLVLGMDRQAAPCLVPRDGADRHSLGVGDDPGAGVDPVGPFELGALGLGVEQQP